MSPATGFVAGCSGSSSAWLRGAPLLAPRPAATARPRPMPSSPPPSSPPLLLPALTPTPRQGAVVAPAPRRVRGVGAAAWPKTTTTQPRAAAEPAAAGQGVKVEAERRMQKTLDATAASFNTIRTGRVSAAILDRVMVEYYGVETPLNGLAGISVQGSSTLIVDPYDKTAMKDIERALMESDVGITPSSDGSVIRLNVPPLTQERRKALVKQVKSLAEDGRVAIRNIRRDAVEKCKKTEKDGDIGKDESKDLQDAVQKSTDKHIKKIDDMLKQKEKDILTV